MKLRKGVYTIGIFVAAITWAGNSPAFDHVTWKDGRRVRVVQTNQQVDLSQLRSGVSGKATDRRFTTNAAMYLANEIYLSGTEFFLRASEAKLPLAHDIEFSYITNVEAYWYSRYNLMSATARGRVGIGVIHGPYLDLRAREATRLNVFGRQRGELSVSNKDVMLTGVIASYLGRSGMPSKYENAVPLMLEFKSADPHFTTPIDTQAGPTGRPRYLTDYKTMSWSHGRMDKTINLGGVGQALLKKVLWAKFFLRRNHMDDDFPGEVFLGNNAEDGLRGSMLTLETVSTMLMTKAALFAEPNSKKLSGIDPSSYRPESGLKYLPHEIRPTLIYMGDMPVRHYDFKLLDASSQLWDQASWLWATAEFFDYANPRHSENWNQVFGYQTPYDGSVMEQKYALLAQSLAATVFDNLNAMHTVDGVLISAWHPKTGPGKTVSVADLSLAMVALAKYAEVMDLDEKRRMGALKVMRKQADFLLRVARPDGSYAQQYNVANGTPVGLRDMTSQAFAIRALVAAHRASGDAAYLEAARKTNAIWNAEFWDEKAWLYRNTRDDDRVVYTPIDVGAALAALREMLLIDKDPKLLVRFKRFFVQSVDVSGMMQAEDIYTGENIDEVRAGNFDSDGDGIPFMGSGDGRYGIDSVFASSVEFDLSKAHKQKDEVTAITAQVRMSGEQIYDRNCAICHGDAGVGNEGPKLIDNPFVQLTGRQSVMNTVGLGRVSVGMPAWSNILSEGEIVRVVDYVQGLGEDEAQASIAGL